MKQNYIFSFHICCKIKNTSLLLSVIFILNAELIRERVNISNELTGGNEKEAMKEEKEHVKITRKKNQPRGGGGKKERADNSPDFRNTQAERNERCARDKGKVRMRIFRFGGGSCRGNNRIHLHPCPSIPSCAASGNLTLSDRTCLSPIVVSGYPSIFSFLFFIPLFLLSLLFFLFYLSTILPSNDSEKYTIKIVQIKRSRFLKIQFSSLSNSIIDSIYTQFQSRSFLVFDEENQLKRRKKKGRDQWQIKKLKTHAIPVAFVQQHRSAKARAESGGRWLPVVEGCTPVFLRIIGQ